MSTEQQQVEAGAEVTVVNKNQKKALKLLKGTGLKKVEGINRVVLRKAQGQTFTIANPEVYRTPNGSYVVLGEPTAQDDVAKQLEALTSAAGSAAPEEAEKTPEAIQADLAASAENLKITEADEDVADEDVDVTGLDPETITMIQEQGNVSKAKAVKALRENNGDLVNTLMQLTS